MHDEDSPVQLTTGMLVSRLFILTGVSVAVGFAGVNTVLNAAQATACAVFLGIILGTLFFWNFRLAIAFIGLSVLIVSNSMNITTFVESSALEVILFLVGMMIIVGALRDLGFFTWIVQLIVSMPNISGGKFIAVTATASALLACAVDEVTSIIFISTLIFQVCDRLKLNPAPYILICVLCTNVGSAGTMMGNPVGIYIGTKGGLTFGDFMLWSFPLMLLALLATVAVTMTYYRKELKQFDVNLSERLSRNLSLVPKIEVPYKQGLALLAVTIVMIASHHQFECWLGLDKNSILLIAPLLCSGVVMILRRERARYYVEREVDWWTLLFFMLLFAIAGTLEHTDVSGVMAHYFSRVCGSSMAGLIPFILMVSAVGSAFVDNVIFVAAFCPVIEELALNLQDLPLWWALLFGSCFGGNITMIGSTANIVALGMLEKRSHRHVTFLQWLKIGLISALLATAIAWAALLLLAPFMPDRYARVPFAKIVDTRVFKNKNVIIRGELTAEISGLPQKNAYRSRILVQDHRTMDKKILVHIPEGLANIEPCREYDFKGKLTSSGEPGFAASLMLEQCE
ncbi:MAG: SLC13 family permease [Victivallales bacterium]|nr:SLC13 family permease [Victivallales bacterium]